MNIITGFFEKLLEVFQTGGQIFISWLVAVVPVLLMAMIFWKSITSLAGTKWLDKLAGKSEKNPILRYMILPFFSAIMYGNPMSMKAAKSLPEKHKPSYFASQAQFCHTSSGLFPHVNPGEIFVWLGIALGIGKIGLNPVKLAAAYLFAGLVLNFAGGWMTDFTTSLVSKKKNIQLKRVK